MLTDLYQEKNMAQFKKGKFINTEFNNDGSIVLKQGFTYGEYISIPVAAKFKFNEAIISWNCKTSPDTGIAVYLRAGEQKRWTSWYLMGQWGYTAVKNYDEKIKKDTLGKVNDDTLLLKNKENMFQYRILFFSKDKKESPQVKMISVCYSDIKTNKKVSIKKAKDFSRIIEVPYRSQKVEKDNISGKICGPTSLSMIMEYYKINLPTEKTAYACYDKPNDIYGNWPYLVAYASENNLTGWVQYFTSLEQLKEEISKGYPVIVGIAFGEGQLTGSPVPSSPGHLLVVRGFDKNGNVYVNDPAFKTREKGVRGYKRDEFTKAWLKQGLGVVLLFREQ
ncbi:MAG: peptidase C39 family protein [Armatimonadota bacterium]